jgi:hypothetical protein
MTEASTIDELVQRFKDMGRVAAEQAIAEGQDITDSEQIVALVTKEVVKISKKPAGAALLTLAAAAALFNETWAAYEKRVQELQAALTQTL